MELKTVSSPDAPAPIGPYSQAVRAGTTLYLSGQIGIDPRTGSLAGPTIQEQTRQVMANMRAVLAAAGATLSAVTKVTVFLTSLDDFAAFNAEYAQALGGHTPARSTVQVAALPKGALVEVESVACL